MRRSAAALALALLLPLPGLAGEVTVKPGETLSEIAERHGTTVQRLMQLNNLRSPQDLWAGSRIQVPGAGGGSGRGSAGSGSGNYTVKSGETLSEIAERHGTSVERLMQINGLRSPQDLWAGSRIQVPGASPARSSGSSTAKAPVNRNAREHTVQPGETLSEIADRYGIPMERLVSLNKLGKPNDLQAGATLKLRSPLPATAAKPPVRPRPTTVASKPGASKPVASKPVAGQSTASKPASKPSAKPAATPAASATPTAAATASKPATSSSSRPNTATAQPTTATKPTTVATRPTTSTAAAAAPAASKPTTTTAARPAKPSSPDWRSYGPLQVDWANWQPMAGSYVAPSLNSEGQPLYLAINCTARRLNATGQSGTWKTWDAPQSDFEQQLISDLCKAKGS
ncbi:MAG: LysM peptidoglycan-binding domain-containing protein [Vulcanococcus sp.]